MALKPATEQILDQKTKLTTYDIGQLFSALDTNKDGNVTMSELQAFLKKFKNLTDQQKKGLTYVFEIDGRQDIQLPDFVKFFRQQFPEKCM